MYSLGVPPSQTLEDLEELKGFRFPSPPEKMQGLIDGIDAVAPVKNINLDVGGIINPPVANLVTGVETTLESATGASFGQLAQMASQVSTLASATDPAQVFMAINQLMSGTLDLAAGASKEIATAVETLQSIPYLGMIMNAVLGFIGEVLKSQARYAEAQAKCQQRVDQKVNNFCSTLSRQSTPRPTGPQGQTPADLFRPLAVQYQKGSRKYPANVSTMYLMLCGKETRGFGLLRNDSLPPGVKLGIPVETQRRMWRIIEGLMKQAKNPSIDASFQELSSGDDGYSLMPILQDIVYNEWTSGRIDRNTLNFLSDYALRWTYRYEECPDLTKGEIAAGGMPAGGGSCASRINLSEALEGSITTYKNQLRAYYWDPAKNDWKLPKAVNYSIVGNKAFTAKAKGLIKFAPEQLRIMDKLRRDRFGSSSSSSSKTTAKSGSLSTTSVTLPHLSDDQRKAAIATTSVVLGGGGFLLARRLAK